MTTPTEKPLMFYKLVLGVEGWLVKEETLAEVRTIAICESRKDAEMIKDCLTQALFE